MTKQYIDSQEHWEDEINADYDNREREAKYIESETNKQIQEQLTMSDDRDFKELENEYELAMGRNPYELPPNVIEFIEWTHIGNCPYEPLEVQGDVFWEHKTDSLERSKYMQELFEYYLINIKGK